ncbi:dipeptide ABC transporter ATP-binding protein [Wenxinia marina]|uniref:Oligopeptide/dipeptide ABC transporter, ATP-binding protein n=1 Tax=Wenxinia marina DSM 24838 TaxID=1123501 RepID=A0A0D0Q726_9RHOB|nr:ABC transporter ATP-binding protein [Wenxinia marina]KIQ68242.1 oligopeptide/dipeptide ABC transporter, ATP-binding protein [Wenxinia marina DSM 24838]GGL77008.1 ABC transporter ATP-binding protein [Wenxinia marina]
MDDTILDVSGLSLDFRTGRGRIRALRDVSFPVRRGRILGIVGESGSGKSTVLWSILGLLARNAEVTSGRIAFQGRDLLGLDDEALRAIRGEKISVVFQDPMTSQIPVLPYARQFSDILYRRSMSRAEKRDAAVELLRRVGIPDPEDRIDAYPHQFSGGMRQRAAIAMSMLTGPNLLLADEPTTALDVTMEAQMIDLMRDLRAAFDTTIVVVSHNLGLIAEMCDDVVVMYAGEVVETGEVRDIFHNARHPYTRALLECDPARVERTGGRLPVIPGDIPDLSASLTGCIFAARCPRAMPICRTETPPDVARGTGHARCHLLEGPGADPDWPPPAGVVAVGRTDPPPAAVRPKRSGEPLLEVRGLNVRFGTMGPIRARIRGVRDPFVDAVLDVDLSVAPGETLALVGESGSGKSTLGRAILNLLPVNRGSVSFDGQSVENRPERRFKPLRRDMAMMFQDPVGSLSPRKSVRALITEPLVIHGAGGRDLNAEAERLADMVRLPRNFLSRYPHELSGGQARRVGVARALSLNPRLIIADEPTAGLDVSVQGEILNLMADLQAEHGLGYLIITHNLPVVRHIADRIAIMYLGRMVEEGPAAEVFAAPAHPYTHALVSGVPYPDPDRRRPPSSAISGEVPSLLRRPPGCDFAPRCPFARPACREAKPPTVHLSPERRHACLFPLVPPERQN